MRKVLVALVLAFPAVYGCSCNSVVTDIKDELTPKEVWLDYGRVFVNETSSKEFSLGVKGRTQIPVSLPTGTELPKGFSLDRTHATVNPGTVEKFNLTFAPV